MIEGTHAYDDIIDMPHHVSKKHPPMSMGQRAAQFAPFAALTGYEDSVRDAARSCAKHGPDSESYVELEDLP